MREHLMNMNEGDAYVSAKQPAMERQARIHEAHRMKTGMHGVAAAVMGNNHSVNMEASYKAHHEGHDMAHVMRQMGAPKGEKMTMSSFASMADRKEKRYES